MLEQIFKKFLRRVCFYCLKIDLPTHRRNVGGIKSSDHQALLQHLLEFETKRERHLSSNKSLKNAANTLESHHINDRLKILLQHLVHHVRVTHHIHATGTDFF
jgi:hypothetical protein